MFEILLKQKLSVHTDFTFECKSTEYVPDACNQMSNRKLRENVPRAKLEHLAKKWENFKEEKCEIFLVPSF